MANWDSYRHDLDTLRSELGELLKKRKEIEAKIDEMRRIQIAEEEEQQRQMKPTAEVQLWLSSVQAVETEVDELIKQASEEIEKFHAGGSCSRNFNMSSSYEFEDTVADKLQAVKNLIKEGAFLVADEVRVVTTLKDEGALEAAVPETIPEDEADDQWPIVGMEWIFKKVWKCLKKGGGGDDDDDDDDDDDYYYYDYDYEEEEEDDDDVGIIGVYGMGGVGKTTLLKQINKKLLQRKNDFDVVIWVVVSRDLQLDKIQEQIGEKIGLFDNNAWKDKNFEERASDIFKILGEKKFVLLMDGLWEMVDLTKVGVPLPSRENSSKIVFTTRSLQICSLMEADKLFKVTCLSDDDAWELFKALVGNETLKTHPEVWDHKTRRRSHRQIRDHKTRRRSHRQTKDHKTRRRHRQIRGPHRLIRDRAKDRIVRLARDVCKKCCGLPLALVSIGQTVSKKTPEEWSAVLDDLSRSMTSYSGSDDQLKKVIRDNLRSSYDNLQNDMFKSCFLYCCLFPRDSEIKKRDLIDFWIGEGFLDERLGAVQSRGHYIVDVFLSVCLLEQSGKGDSSVKMHYWIHDMSLWIASKIEMEKGNCFFCTDTDILIDKQVTENLKKATRMSLLDDEVIEKLPDPLLDEGFPLLQTLFLIGNGSEVISEDAFFNVMPLLKVLNLSHNSILTELPGGISNLISLQHLDLSSTNIEELPKELRVLKKLKCLNLENTCSLRKIPRQLISEFSVLHVLRLWECGFMLQSNEECNDAQLLIEELLCLKNLSMLSITLNNSHALQRLLSSNRLKGCIQSLCLRDLSHPRSIKVPLTDLKDLNTLEISHCEYLGELEVDFVGEAQAVRESPPSFYFLHEVIISICRKLRDLTWLILAPNLKHLEISYCDEMEEIINVGKLSECPELMGNVIPFSKLKRLTLKYLPKLRSIYWTDLPFPDLKEPFIWECPMLPPRQDCQLRESWTSREKMKRNQKMQLNVTKFPLISESIEWLDLSGEVPSIANPTEDCIANIYEVKELEYSEALELFLNYANPTEDSMVLSTYIVDKVKGNPLALKVLGSILKGKSKQVWESVLDTLQRSLNPEILDVLKISYDGLDNEEKNLFLDIACFEDSYHGMLKKELLDCEYSLSVLIAKSLVTVDRESDYMAMHDLLREMGREIVRRESPKNPGKRSRLWERDDVIRMLKNNTGTDAVEGISLDMVDLEEDIYLSSQVFNKMHNLRILLFRCFDMSNKVHCPDGLSFDMSNKVHCPDGLNCLPDELRILHWFGYPLRALPSNFNPKKLVELDISNSNIEQLWEGTKHAPKLKWLNLSRCPRLTKIPNLSDFPLLVELDLNGCESLVDFPSSFQQHKNLRNLNLHCTAIEEVPSSIQSLTNLTELDLSKCTRLKHISTSICKLKSLSTLDLRDCYQLETFPEIFETMEFLKTLSLSGSAIKELPSSIERLNGLRGLTLSKCKNFEMLPSSICNLTSLEDLDLSYCSKLDKLPDNLGNLKSLKCLNILGYAVGQLPSSITCLENLEFLDRSFCSGLTRLTPLLGLHSLQTLRSNDCCLMEIPEDIGRLSSLKELELCGNMFESLPKSIKHLSKLEFLSLRDCKMLRSISDLPEGLKRLEAMDCDQLCQVPDASEFMRCINSKSHFSTYYHHHRVDFIFINSLNLIKAVSNVFEESLLIMQHTEKGSGKPPNEFVIFLPGNKIPEGFSYRSLESSVTFRVLRNDLVNRKFMGIAICAVFGFDEYNSRREKLILSVGCDFEAYYDNIEICNGSRYYSTHYRPDHPIEFVHFDHMLLGYCSFDSSFQNPEKLLAGDSDCVDISIEFKIPNRRGQLKCCAVHPIYAEEPIEIIGATIQEIGETSGRRSD